MSVFEDIIKFGEDTEVALVVTDPKRRVEYVNLAFTRLSGHERSEVLGTNPWELLEGPETSEATRISFGDGLQSREPFDDKIFNYHKDSHRYIAGLFLVPFHDRFTEHDHILALERELVSWEEDLLDDPHYAKSLADIVCILTE